jgi:hypothetical protein
MYHNRSGLNGIAYQYQPGAAAIPANSALAAVPMPQQRVVVNGNGRPVAVVPRANGNGMGALVPVPGVPDWLLWGLAGAGAMWLFNKYVK